MKKIIEVRNGQNIRLSDYSLFVPDIKNLWLISDEDQMWNHYRFNPDNGLKVTKSKLDSLKPSHGHGVFLKERGQDWDIDYENNLLQYHSYQGSEEIKLLIEYEKMKCLKCPNSEIGGYDVRFCRISGYSKYEDSFCTSTEKEIFLKSLSIE